MGLLLENLGEQTGNMSLRFGTLDPLFGNLGLRRFAVLCSAMQYYHLLQLLFTLNDSEMCTEQHDS